MILLLVILTALLPFGGEEREKRVWTLEQCLKRGMEEGVEIKKLELEEDAAKECKNLSFMDWIPELNICCSNDFNWGRSVDMQELVIVKNRESSSASLSASASVSSLRILSSIFSSEEREASVKKALSGSDDGKMALAIRITDAYLQLLLSLKMCDNAKADYDNILIQQSRVAKEVEAGQLSYGSLFEIQAQAASERESLVEAEGRTVNARLTLKEYLNLSAGEELTVSPPVDDSLPPPDVIPHLSRIPSFITRHPRMIVAESSKKVGSARKKMALLNLLPDLSVTGCYSTGASSAAGGTLPEQFRGNWNPAINLVLTIPVISGSGNILRYREASRQRQILELEAERCRRELQADMEKAIAEAENSYRVCLAARENMEAMQKSFSTSQARFEAGMISGSEYLICRGNLQKAVSLYWQAKFRYLFQLKVIDYRMGLTFNRDL